MARTEEQIASDNALEAAITENLQAYGLLTEGWVLADWVICLSMEGFNAEALGRTKYAHVIPGESLPYHRLLGLMDVTRMNLDEEARGDG